jgi:hypothetical protein
VQLYLHFHVSLHSATFNRTQKQRRLYITVQSKNEYEYTNRGLFSVNVRQRMGNKTLVAHRRSHYKNLI